MENCIKLWCLIVVLTFFQSCRNHDKRVPLEHSEELIRQVMIDLYVSEQALRNLSVEDQDSLRILYRKQIEEIHEVKIDAIEKDLEIIKYNPKWNLDFHATVKDSIKAMDAELNNAKKKEAKKRIEENMSKTDKAIKEK